MNGKGTFKFISGDSFTGNFFNGTRNGVGKYIYANGDVYKCFFRKDFCHRMRRLNFYSLE